MMLGASSVISVDHKEAPSLDWRSSTNQTAQHSRNLRGQAAVLQLPKFSLRGPDTL
jgi:hypothetical protein